MRQQGSLLILLVQALYMDQGLNGQRCQIVNKGEIVTRGVRASGGVQYFLLLSVIVSVYHDGIPGTSRDCRGVL